jgi:hypothetical protein
MRPNANVPSSPDFVRTKGMASWEATPAYHGTLAIDAASGAIVRLTLEAELDPDNTITRASTIVEYGRVVIGDQPFICPVRSLAISALHGPPPSESEAEAQTMPIVSVNETTFTDYHRLGSSARMLADGTPPGGVTLPQSPSPNALEDKTPPNGDPEFGSSASTSLKDSVADAVNTDEEKKEIAVSAAIAPADAGVAVKLNIAAANLGLENQDGRWVGKLDIFVVQRAAGSGIRDRVDSLTLNLRLKPDTYQRMLSTGIPFQHTLEMQRGMTSMRVLVLDENTGRLGSVTVSSSALQAGKQATVASRQPDKP